MEDALEGRAFFEETADAEICDAVIAEAAKVDSSAFGVLYDRYYARVYRFVYHRVGNMADAEDLTSVIFMKTLEALPQFQSGRSGFAPWLFRIARNTVIDHYRKGGRQQPLDALEREASDHDPVADVLGAEQRQELHALVSHLSPEQRDVVLMRYAADLSYPEIAAALRKQEPAVRMLLHRGLRKMKAILDDGQE